MTKGVRHRLSSLGLVFFLVLFALYGKTWSQTTLVTLEGVVVDEQGNALPGTVINLRNMDTGYIYSAPSRADGRYIISGIQPGRLRG